MIKDYDYSFVISDKTEIVEGKTELINGFLDAFILKSTKKCHIKIVMAENEDIVLFDDLEYQGSHYIPLRITPISKNAEMFNYSPQRFSLNNSLKVYIEGIDGTEIDLTIRTEEDGRLNT